MKRKVARIGPSTLMVSLPSKWVKHHHIEKGQELNVEEKEGRLIIHPTDVSPFERAELTLKKKDQFLQRYLRSFYHRGFAEVKIICEEGIDIHDIKRELDTYLGFEIIEQGKKYCIIRNVADAMEQEFDGVLRKIFLMNMNMAEESLHHLQTASYAGLTEIAAIEKTNNKLINLSYRILNKSGKLSDQHAMSLYTALFCLENIADHYRDLCLYAQEKRMKLTSDLQNFYMHLNQHYRQLMELYYKFDPEKMLALRNTRGELEKEGKRLSEKSQREQTQILFHLRSVLNYLKDMELTLGFGRP